ncbi:winged helix-turn-helix transcriptional regulator [Agromyces aureus]|uniref:winged helix-turn-helix transcriptional regulator n=1 Tax=Agromyces aureus TaxID=453304 RepID=UPI000A04545B|nr:helix-turn-helix domain-containing protein [Agromyces aureus]
MVSHSDVATNALSSADLGDDLAAHRARLEQFGHIDEAACRRFQRSVEFAGRKWNGAILLAGVRGARRFSEYRATVDGISDRLLAARLKELEAEGVIERHVKATTPVTITYTPSASGLQLIELLQPLVEWDAGHMAAREGGDAARDAG